MARVSSRELVEWQVYYSLEPFGAERDAAHAGMIASTVANFSGFRKEGTVFKPSDFMIDYARERETSDEELQAKREEELHATLVALATTAASAPA